MNEGASICGLASFPLLDSKLLEGRDQVVLCSGTAGVSGSLEEGHVTKATAGSQRRLIVELTMEG